MFLTQNKILKFFLAVFLSFSVMGCNSKQYREAQKDDFNVEIIEEDTVYGYRAVVTITNKTDRVLFDWEISFKCKAKVRDVTNGTFRARGNHYKVYSTMFNHAVLPGKPEVLSISLEKESELADFKFKSKVDNAVYVETKITNHNFEYDESMECYFVSTLYDELVLEAEDTEYSKYVVHNSFGDLVSEGEVTGGRIPRIRFETGYNELELRGKRTGQDAVSYIHVFNSVEIE